MEDRTSDSKGIKKKTISQERTRMKFLGLIFSPPVSTVKKQKMSPKFPSFKMYSQTVEK